MIGQAERVAQLLQQGQGAYAAPLPIIGFFSGKGGTGKTFLAQQAAYLLASRGIPNLLIDMNFQNPNLHIMNNVFADRTVNDLLQARALFEEVVTEPVAGMYCIYGSADEQIELRDSQIMVLMRALQKRAGYFKAVLLDTPPGIHENLIRMTTSQVVVTNPEPTSVMDGYVVAKAIGLLDNANSVAVINRCRTVDEGNTAYTNLNRALQHFQKQSIPLAGLIPQHADIYDSIMQQQIFLRYKPNSPACAFIEKVVLEISKSIIPKK